jgi:hypothetical protein
VYLEVGCRSQAWVHERWMALMELGCGNIYEEGGTFSRDLLALE